MPYYNKVGVTDRGLPHLRERCKNKYSPTGKEKCTPINAPAPAVDTIQKKKFHRVLEAMIAWAKPRKA